MSLCLHLAIVLMLAAWIDTSPKGTGDEPGRPIGIAVAHRMADRTEYEPAEAPAETTAESTEASEASSAAATASAPALARPLDIDGLLAEVTDTPMENSGVGTGTALEAGSGEGTGPLRRGEGTGPEATAMFFGVSGSGRRFVYVIDRSDSMNGAPLSAAKRETIRSLGSLGPDHSFQIIVYNNRSQYANPEGQAFWMLPASDAMKRWATQYIRAVPAHGGTEHYDALKLALKLEPDVIFFLSDAHLPRLRQTRLNEIRVLCERVGTTIHAVEFGTEFTPPKDSFLIELAAGNGGEYRYLDVRTLRPPQSSDEL